MKNPELLPGYTGPRGLNFYETDHELREAIEARVDRAAAKRLSAFGAVCGGELGALIEAAHEPEKLPVLVKGEIKYCDEQKKARSILGKTVYGTPGLSLVERLSLSVLANFNGEGGITCPLAMTEGLIGLLEKRGTPEQKRTCLPLLRSSKPDEAVTGGQYVTERQGGSNVSANETIAKPLPDGAYRLTGLKWFCSNPGELWVTTAKLEGTSTIGLFLVRRKLANGKPNGHEILKLKRIGGTKGKATAEVEYKDARAELIGKPREGLSILINEIIGVSRIHSAAASLGFMSRALLEAETFADYREAYGRKIKGFPSVKRSLQWMREERRACLQSFYRMADAVERDEAAAEWLVPMNKIEISKRSSALVREAQLVIGGHGILEDFSILPRLADDAVVNEIWEGTHNILAGHSAKALRRPAVLKEAEALLASEDAKVLRARVEKNRAMDDDERNVDDAELTSLSFTLISRALAAEKTAARAA